MMMLAMLIDLSVKATAVLALAAGVALVWRRGSAAGRHLIWTAGMVGVFLLPVISWALPEWRVLPGWARWTPPATAAFVPTLPNIPVAEPPLSWRGGPWQTRGLEDPQEIAARGLEVKVLDPNTQTSRSVGELSNQSTGTGAVSGTALRRKGGTTNGAEVFVWVWVAGVACMMAPLIVSWVALWRTGRRAAWLVTRRGTLVRAGRDRDEVNRNESQSALGCAGEGEAWGELLGELCARLGIRRGVRLVRGGRRDVPMTFGIWRPTILVPTNEWGAERRRVVLLHELAHIKRRDCLTMLLARVVRAGLWFHPLAWVACARVAAEAERACDDLVLAAGTKGSDYANELVTIAAGFQGHPALAAAALTMARPSTLEGRVRAILDGTRNRRGVTRKALLAALVLAIGVMVPVACMKGAPEDVKRTGEATAAMYADGGVGNTMGATTRGPGAATKLDGVEHGHRLQMALVGVSADDNQERLVYMKRSGAAELDESDVESMTVRDLDAGADAWVGRVSVRMVLKKEAMARIGTGSGKLQQGAEMKIDGQSYFIPKMADVRVVDGRAVLEFEQKGLKDDIKELGQSLRALAPATQDGVLTIEEVATASPLEKMLPPGILLTARNTTGKAIKLDMMSSKLVVDGREQDVFDLFNGPVDYRWQTLPAGEQFTYRLALPDELWQGTMPKKIQWVANGHGSNVLAVTWKADPALEKKILEALGNATKSSEVMAYLDGLRLIGKPALSAGLKDVLKAGRKAFSDENYKDITRMEALQLVAQNKLVELAPELRTCLKSDSVAVVRASLLAIGALPEGQVAGVADLAALAGNKDSILRRYLAGALRQAGGDRGGAAALLHRMIADEDGLPAKDFEEHAFVKIWACQALVKFEDRSGVPVLMDLLQNEASRDFRGNITSVLHDITGQTFDSEKQWLEWWKSRGAATGAGQEPKEAMTGLGQALRALAPATTQEAAGGDSPWGEAVDGIQLRLRPERSIWNVQNLEGRMAVRGDELFAAKSPVLKLEVRNGRKETVEASMSAYSYRLEFDGKVYDAMVDVKALQRSVKPGETSEAIDFPLKELGGPMFPGLTPGKHTVRAVAWTASFLPKGDKTVYSNPATVVMDADGPQPTQQVATTRAGGAGRATTGPGTMAGAAGRRSPEPFTREELLAIESTDEMLNPAFILVDYVLNHGDRDYVETWDINADGTGTHTRLMGQSAKMVGATPVRAVAMRAAREQATSLPPSGAVKDPLYELVVAFRNGETWEVREYDKRALPEEVGQLLKTLSLSNSIDVGGEPSRREVEAVLGTIKMPTGWKMATREGEMAPYGMVAGTGIEVTFTAPDAALKSVPLTVWVMARDYSGAKAGPMTRPGTPVAGQVREWGWWKGGRVYIYDVNGAKGWDGVAADVEKALKATGGVAADTQEMGPPTTRGG